MRKKLQWHEIDIGDVLKDYRPSRQEWVHYLIVDKKEGERYVVGYGVKNIVFYVLQPLDCDDTLDVELSRDELHREYSTWRKVA